MERTIVVCSCSELMVTQKKKGRVLERAPAPEKHNEKDARGTVECAIALDIPSVAQESEVVNPEIGEATIELKIPLHYSLVKW